MSNNISIRNIDPQQITISGAGQPTGITNVYVNGVDVTVGTKAYVLVPTNNNELLNGAGYITAAEETDPTVPAYVKAISLADINSWNDKQDQLVSGSTIKTINNTSLLGSGDIEIVSNYVAGTGIDITDNTISNTITSYQDLTDTPTIPSRTSDLINDSGFITNQTDSLVNYLTTEVLEDILPHTSDSGTGDLYLEDSVKYKIKMELNPSEIQQTTYNGYNLLNLTDGTYSNNGVDAVVTNGVVTLSGTASANAFIDIPVAPDLTWTNTETYTVSAFNSSTASVNIRINTSGTFDTQLNATNKTNTFTYGNEANMTTNKIILRVQSGASLSDFSFTPMIEIGSGSATYEPYVGGMPVPNPLYPQDIHVTSGKNSITVCGKNLLDRSTCEDNKGLVWVDGALFNETKSLTSDLIRVAPNQELVMSYKAGIFFYDKNENYIGALQSDMTTIAKNNGAGATVNNFTVPNIDSIYYMKLTFRTGANGGIDLTTVNIQVENGSTATSYVPYQSQEYPIDLSTMQVFYGNNDICKISTTDIVYENVIFKNTPDNKYYSQGNPDGEILINTGIVKYVFNANDNWVQSGNYFELSLTDAIGYNPNFGSIRHYAICSHFQDYSLVSDHDNESWIRTSGPFVDIHFDPNMNITSVEDLQTWISNNYVVMYGIRGGYSTFDEYTTIDGFAPDDPTYLQYKEILNNAESYDGGTNISQENDDLPFDIEADTLRKIS